MIEIVVNKILNIIQKYKPLEVNDVNIYRYGIEVIIADLSNFVVIILPSIMINKLIIGITFIIVFCMIRRYSGGYHCSTSLRCNICYFTIYMILVLLINIITNYHHAFINLLFYLSSVGIIYIGPINCLDILENEVIYHKKRKNILISLLSLYLLMMISNVEIIFTIKYSIFVIFLLMIIEIKERRGRK